MATATARKPPARAPQRPADPDAPASAGQLLSVPQAARLLGVSPQALLQAIWRWAAGRPGLPATRLNGKAWLIRRADLSAYAARKRPDSAQHVH